MQTLLFVRQIGNTTSVSKFYLRQVLYTIELFGIDFSLDLL